MKHWDAFDVGFSPDTEAKEKALAELNKAIKDRRWLVVLNAHAAPQLVLDMLHALSLSSYLIRGDGARSFRLFLATPHPALFQPTSKAIPLTLRAQSMRVVISPIWGSWGTVGTGASSRITLRAACQTLGHPHASYLGFYNKV